MPGKDYFFNELISAMKLLKETGIFKELTDEITFFVSISDDEDAENLEDYSASQLNSLQLASAFLDRAR